MMNKKKRFVIREGKKTGIFDNREECKNLVQGYKNAKFKSFISLAEAKNAFSQDYKNYIGTKTGLKSFLFQKKETDCIFVDAACSSNPGILERKGVDIKGDTIFQQGPYQNGTVNIGEFLAICQGLGYLKKLGKNKTKIYSDSKTAILWVKNKKTNTKLEKDEKNKILFDLIKRAEEFLQNNIFENKILKRETKTFGEIPADFGRK